jgi:hypothetical protein
MKHIRLYEEYKYFKVANKHNGEKVLWEEDNVHDPDEPFWNWKKGKYTDEKNEKQCKERLDRDLAELGMTEPLKQKINSIGSFSWVEKKEDVAIKKIIINCNEINRIQGTAGITYFEDENDYILEISMSRFRSDDTFDLSGDRKKIKKKFDSLEDTVNWLVNSYRDISQQFLNEIKTKKEERLNRYRDELRGGLTEKLKNKK